MATQFTRRAFGGVMLAAALGAAAAAEDRGYANPGLLVTAAELKPMVVSGAASGKLAYEVEGTVLIDVRPAQDYAAGHIPGARHLDPNAVVDPASPIEGALRDETQIVAIMSALGVSANKRVIFYDDRGGFHAARMFWLSEYLGHQNVALLDGGWSAWLAERGPVSTQAPDIVPAAFAAAPMPRRLATADLLMDLRDDPDTVVIDVRPEGMFLDGHIPWAVNVPWSQNLTDEGRFKSAAVLANHFAAHGVTHEKRVIIHCQVGLASSHSYVALRLLGHPQVRVYHRSWAEWGSDPDLPAVIGG